MSEKMESSNKEFNDLMALDYGRFSCADLVEAMRYVVSDERMDDVMDSIGEDGNVIKALQEINDYDLLNFFKRKRGEL